VALHDSQSVLLLTSGQNTFPFTLRADLRVMSTSSFTQINDVQLSGSVAPTASSTTYKSVVYAGGDTVAFLRSENNYYNSNTAQLAVVHDPTFGTPSGGTGGAGGTGGGGGAGGAGGTGGAPDRCPGCTFTSVQAYGQHLAYDAGRNLIYVSAGAQSALHPSTIVPVGNDPEPLALSDDGSALWVGLAGEKRVRRMTPGTTPTPGPAYSLPMLLTTGESVVPMWMVVLPGTPASIAVAVQGLTYGGQGVFILDDGQPRANFIQPPEVGTSNLINGPPGYLLGVGVSDNLLVYRLGTVGATMESYGGLVSSAQTGFAYRAGFAYGSQGEVVDLTNPDAPLPVGRFAFSGCYLAVRSATRVMMLCPSSTGVGGPILRVLDSGNFVSVGAVTLPDSLATLALNQFAYLGGDAVALLGSYSPLQIMHAPIIGTPP
jgi:hypothetical protein